MGKNAKGEEQRMKQEALTEQGTKQGVAADSLSTNALDVLGQIRAGACVFDLSAKLEELVEMIRERKKGGKLTLTIAMDCMNAGDPSTLVIEDDIKLKEPPRPSKGKTIFFSTSRNTLQREDPRQMRFDDEMGL